MQDNNIEELEDEFILGITLGETSVPTQRLIAEMIRTTKALLEEEGGSMSFVLDEFEEFEDETGDEDDDELAELEEPEELEDVREQIARGLEVVRQIGMGPIFADFNSHWQEQVAMLFGDLTTIERKEDGSFTTYAPFNPSAQAYGQSRD